MRVLIGAVMVMMMGTIPVFCGDAQGVTVQDLLKKVKVERVDLDLSSPHEVKGQLLWDAFANKPYEEQFTDLTSEDWYKKSVRFQERLLELAENTVYDHDSLKSALDSLEIKPDDQIGRVPVGAFVASYDADPVWIIIIKWEYPHCLNKGDERSWLLLSHIEILAFRMKDGAIVDSTKCG